MNKIIFIDQLSELKTTVNKYCGSVEQIYREIGITNLAGKKFCNVVLTDEDALLPLKVGQQVLADLRMDSCKMFGEWCDKYYITSIKPLPENVKALTTDDWTVHLV